MHATAQGVMPKHFKALPEHTSGNHQIVEEEELIIPSSVQKESNILKEEAEKEESCPYRVAQNVPIHEKIFIPGWSKREKPFPYTAYKGKLIAKRGPQTLGQLDTATSEMLTPEKRSIHRLTGLRDVLFDANGVVVAVGRVWPENGIRVNENRFIEVGRHAKVKWSVNDSKKLADNSRKNIQPYKVDHKQANNHRICSEIFHEDAIPSIFDSIKLQPGVSVTDGHQTKSCPGMGESQVYQLANSLGSLEPVPVDESLALLSPSCSLLKSKHPLAALSIMKRDTVIVTQK
ncbi:hypothetical protein Ciccas_006531 [Cichlidogyrus casuarinus]|uniref:Uncharacterized protein n=1 Tax=Cichlidogyrus casuarinus TaxID=1844966 RepID=A0ABD2Q9B8_9PLAT